MGNAHHHAPRESHGHRLKVAPVEDREQEGRLFTLGGPERSSESEGDFSPLPPRRRANTISEGDSVPRDVNTVPTVFKFAERGKQAFIAGTFSDWKKIPMVKSKHGYFVTIIDLTEGRHKYKYCVDGRWRCNPKEKTMFDKSGSKNNIMTVIHSDFDVFEALAEDDESTHPHKEENQYSQEIPTYKASDYLDSPPMLPPQLAYSILNKEQQSSNTSRAMKLEPNHVSLNHMYAESLKDGVMVISTTTRYRQKFVTTLFYKPTDEHVE